MKFVYPFYGNNIKTKSSKWNPNAELKLKAAFYPYTKRISHPKENWILNSFNSKVVLYPNTRDESSSSVNTRITYILHILILQRVFKCTQRLCLRNSCFYALKDWIDVQNSFVGFEKKDKKVYFTFTGSDWMQKENQFLAETSLLFI